MNRDIRALLYGSFTVLLGVLGFVLTTSTVWPSIILALGAIGLLAALVTPARQTPGK